MLVLMPRAVPVSLSPAPPPPPPPPPTTMSHPRPRHQQHLRLALPQVNADEKLHTLPPLSVPFEPTIPTFNVMRNETTLLELAAELGHPEQASRSGAQTPG